VIGWFDTVLRLATKKEDLKQGNTRCFVESRSAKKVDAAIFFPRLRFYPKGKTGLLFAGLAGC
jgi:hypothetical protein